MSQEQHADSADLAQFGYNQKLDRSLGSFSSFAAGFSYISILTGMFQTSYLGFLLAGPAFLWAWPVVFVGQLMVALQFAELSAHYPLAGSVYQWSKQVASKSWAWNTGWMYLAAQIVTVPAVALGYQVILPQISPKFQLIKCDVSTVAGSTCADKNFPSYLDPAFAKNAIILGLVLVAFTTIVNMSGIHITAMINNIGVAAELIGAVLLIALLVINITRGPSIWFETNGTGASHDWGWFGAVLLGAYMPLYVMYGFDTAGSLAEETADPRRTAPRAVIRALFTAGIMGFILIAVGEMAAGNTDAAFSNGLASITKDVFGDTWGNLFLIDVVLAISVCCLAIHAASVRILFAMARDNNLPGAASLARVSGKAKVPVVPAVLVGALSALILLFNWFNPAAFTIVISCGIAFMYLAYLGVTIPLLRRRRAGWPENMADRKDGLFALGKWAIITNVIAIVWGVAGVFNLLWPRADFYGPKWYQQYGVLFATIVVIGAGLVIYYGVQEKKTGVLDEHRAAAPAGD